MGGLHDGPVTRPRRYEMEPKPIDAIEVNNCQPWANLEAVAIQGG